MLASRTHRLWRFSALCILHPSGVCFNTPDSTPSRATDGLRTSSATAAFGPYVAGAAWLRLAGRLDTSGGLDRPPVHIGLPLYPAGHSLIVFLVVFGIISLLARRIVFERRFACPICRHQM
jgi:hypothetical protein